MFVLAALAFVSCDKEIETTSATIDQEDTARMATITVKGFAELDATVFGNEVVPSGSSVLITAPKNDFISGANGTIVKIAEYVNGVLTVDVPATEDGVTYTITPLDFEYELVTNPAEYSDASTLPKRYYASSVDVEVMIGESKLETIDYNMKDAGAEYIEYVTLDGEITGEFDEETPGYEELDDDITLLFYNSDYSWYESVTTVDGTFTVEVPQGESIMCAFDFVTEKNFWDFDESEYDEKDFSYQGTNSFGSFYSDSSSDFNVGTGEAVEE